jgi:hypothetical protein
MLSLLTQFMLSIGIDYGRAQDIKSVEIVIRVKSLSMREGGKEEVCIQQNQKGTVW